MKHIAVVIMCCGTVALLARDSVGQVLYTLMSPNPKESGKFGYSAACAGDVDSDGCPDAVVGAPCEAEGTCSDAGRAYVFSGATGALLHSLVGGNNVGGAGFGRWVSGAGDADGDGHDDLVVGAPFWGDPQERDSGGQMHVLSGETGSAIYQRGSPEDQYCGRFGYSVSGVGDLDGDGLAEVLVGAPCESLDNHPQGHGMAYVFRGSAGSLLHFLLSPNEQAGGGFGWAVSGVGDVDNDGRSDFAVGAPWEDTTPATPNAGRAYVFSGRTGALIHTLVSANQEISGMFGWSVAGAGDVNGDGWPDIVVGALWEDPGVTGAGRAYVFSGQTGALLHTLVSPNAEYSGNFGHSVCGAGDLNNDGYADVLVGATGEERPSSPWGAGCAYVFSGRTGDLLHVLFSPNECAGGFFGHSVSGLGDVNGDGRSEVLVGACGESSGVSPFGCGRTYVITLPPVMALSGGLAAGALELQWPGYSGAWEYWVYGAANHAYFEPGLAEPYQHRLATLPAGALAWSSVAGVGDTDHNWTYQVVAVNASGEAMCFSDRVAEQDLSTGTAP
jgi:hypothetical protein